MCDATGDCGGCGADTEPPRRRRAPGDRCEPVWPRNGPPGPLPVPPGIPPGISPRAASSTAPMRPPVPPRCPSMSPVSPGAATDVPPVSPRCCSRYPFSTPQCHPPLPVSPRYLSVLPPVSPGNIPGVSGAARGPPPLPLGTAPGGGSGPGAPGDRPCPRSHPRTCMKCGQGTAALVIRVGDPFCR